MDEEEIKKRLKLLEEDEEEDEESEQQEDDEGLVAPKGLDLAADAEAALADKNEENLDANDSD